MQRGIIQAALAYFLWGLLPLYWKLLSSMPALEILAHRIVWSLVFFAAYLLWKNRWAWLREFFRDRQQLFNAALCSVLIAANWGIYIWAVNADRVVETSLGYFINPLMSVGIGVLLLGERLRRWQWVSVCVATVGVGILTLSFGSLPWISLSLALTFALYGLLKKKTALSTMQGMFVETIGVFFPAFLYLVYLPTQGEGQFASSAETTVLLMASGTLTALPLMLFAGAAKQIPLSMLGLLQYIAPTLQFIIGVFIFRESFGPERLLGFCFIWAALVLFTWERIAVGRYKKTRPISGP